MQLTQEQKLEEALKGTFPASDAFYVPPERSAWRNAQDENSLEPCSEPAAPSS